MTDCESFSQRAARPPLCGESLDNRIALHTKAGIFVEDQASSAAPHSQQRRLPNVSAKKKTMTMRQPLLTLALSGLMTLSASGAFAQETSPAPAAPIVQEVAPSQPSAIPSEPSSAPPSAGEPMVVQGQEGNVLPSASPAIATAPAPTQSAAAEPAAHTDLYTIVMSSHWVVMAVMALLAFATFAVLVILIHKFTEFALAFGKLRRSAKTLLKATTLAEAEAMTRDHKGPAAEMIRAASHEFDLAKADPALRRGVRDRTSAALSRIDAGAAQQLRSATGILASIGSLSPFIGLFGTVFGIMNSFLAIAESKTTNLAVVAPGIAEALFATAIGLAAAIPAVLVYNICARKLAKFRNGLGDVAAATERLQSRDLDRLAAEG